jgi:hypothetical protein
MRLSVSLGTGIFTQVGAASLGAQTLTVTASDVDSRGTFTGTGSVVLSPSRRDIRDWHWRPAGGAFNVNDNELALFADGFAGLQIGDLEGRNWVVSVDSSLFLDSVTIVAARSPRLKSARRGFL